MKKEAYQKIILEDLIALSNLLDSISLDIAEIKKKVELLKKENEEK